MNPIIGPHLRPCRSIPLVLISTLLAPISHAADGTTAGAAADASFNWDGTTTAPWSGGTVADGAGFTASFLAELTAARTVTRLPTVHVTDLINATWQAGEPDPTEQPVASPCVSDRRGRTIWYRYRPTTTGVVPPRLIRLSPVPMADS